jgi:hypothetical protein
VIVAGKWERADSVFTDFFLPLIFHGATGVSFHIMFLISIHSISSAILVLSSS